jgi:dihydroorotate dehydrogenase electron transfer subunit
MLQAKAEIVAKTVYQGSCFKLEACTEQGFKAAVPGQFVMVRIPGLEEPLLRRPFSIHGVTGKDHCGIELLIKQVGKGTALLSQLEPGDLIDVIGPLGRGFSLSGVGHNQRILLVAGGIGVAPIRFLLQTLAMRLKEFRRVEIFLGARTDGELLCREELEGLQAKLHITTDDGSAGTKALISDPFLAALERGRPDRVYACGPPGLLRAIIAAAKQKSLFCEVSIETMMACGMGACLGCAIQTDDPDGRYRHACMDGPVFDARRLKEMQGFG